MGCIASIKVAPNIDNAKDKNVNNNKDGKGENEVVKKSTLKIPLSEKEVFSLGKSWKAISRNMSTTGITMFLRMFHERADIKGMFEQFRAQDQSELATSKSLENHAVLVMNSLDDAICNLDDSEYILDMTTLTGLSHRRFENFSENIFWAIEEPFLVAVKETLEDRYTTRMEGIYKRAIHFILDLLVCSFTGKKHEAITHYT